MSKLVIKDTVATFEHVYEGGYDKKCPSEDLVRLESWFLGNIPGKVLDYGCGPGTNGLFLLDSGYEVMFTDVAGAALGKVQEKLDVRPAEANSRATTRQINPADSHIPDQDNTFDYVICLSVLSNLGTADSVKWALQEFSRILKPGGKIIFDINAINTTYVKDGNEVEETVYSTKPRKGFESDEILMYFPKSQEEFGTLVSSVPSLVIDDFGHSSFSYQGYDGYEYIVCAHKSD